MQPLACSGSMLIRFDYITKVGLNSLPIASLDLSKMLNMFCEGICSYISKLLLVVVVVCVHVHVCMCMCACV